MYRSYVLRENKMKKLLLSVIMLWIVFAMHPGTIMGQELVAEMIHPDFAPYYTQKKGYDDFGILPAIASEAFKQQGIPVKHDWMPYARALMLFREAQVPIHLGNDAIFTNDTYIRSVKVLKIEFRFYSYTHKSLAYNDLSELKKYKIGTYISGGAVPVLTQNGISPEYKKNTEILVKMLYAERLDFATTESLGFLTCAKELYPEAFPSLFVSDQIILSGHGSIMFNTKHPDGQKLYGIFIKEYNKLKKNKQIYKIAERYFKNVNLDIHRFLED